MPTTINNITQAKLKNLRILVNFTDKKVIHSRDPINSTPYLKLLERGYECVGTIKGNKMMAYWLRDYFEAQAKYIQNEENNKTGCGGICDNPDHVMDGL